NVEVDIRGQKVPFGTEMLFDIAGVQTGIEICEDLWVTDPPSRRLTENGALVIANPSASPELVGKAEYRRQLVGMQAARLALANQPNFKPAINLPADPFLPKHETAAERTERMESIINIAVTGLVERMRHSGIEKVVLGLSGGLDSTLAVLFACRAARMLGKEP